MLPENETKLYALLENDSLADQVLALIHADEAERHTKLLQRQMEGLKRARQRGVRLGRPPVKRPKNFASVYALFSQANISARTASQILKVSPGTFKRWALEEEANRPPLHSD